MSKEICYHPEMRPTQWNQPKPEPAEMYGCECGANMHCPVCGWGRGSWPCKCRPSVIDEYRAGRTRPLKEFVSELEEENDSR